MFEVNRGFRAKNIRTFTSGAATSAVQELGPKDKLGTSGTDVFVSGHHAAAEPRRWL